MTTLFHLVPNFFADGVVLGMLSNPILATLVNALIQFLNIYWALLIIRILLTWFPQVNWSNPIFSTLSQLTDPYLNIFRSIIPPLGGFDFSAVLAILLLGLVRQAVSSLAY